MGLRDRLRLVVGTIALAVMLLMAIGVWSGAQEARELDALERRLVPKLETGPRVQGAYLELRRSIQDAVSAEDGDALDATRELHDKLLAEIERARAVLPAKDSDALRSLAQEYFGTAYGVSRRLIAGESGEPLTVALATMQRKQLALSRSIEERTRLNPAELERAFAATHRARKTGDRLRFGLGLACLGLVLGLSWKMGRDLLRAVREISDGLGRFAKSDFSRPIPTQGMGELRELSEKANDMARNLREHAEQRARTDWLKTGVAGLNHELRGELFPEQAAGRAVRFLVRYLNAPAGALYFRGDDVVLKLLASHALGPSEGVDKEHVARSSFRVGEGLIGQAALEEELRVYFPVPEGYTKIRSGLGEAAPHTLVLIPLVRQGQVIAVIELLLWDACTPRIRELLESARDSVAVALEVARSRSALGVLLEESRQQAKRLANQEEELRTTNQELLAQQEELRLANDELQAQRGMLAQRNEELEGAQRAMKQKNDELATVSAYKSQFLANMSHELRTPLNSMLLLSHLLSENTTGNLSERQVEFCKTIHGAGSDLLRLINQVLDLAKIEAGRQDLAREHVTIADLAEHSRRIFAPLASDRGLSFQVEIEPNLPEAIWTDRRRVEQVLVNLLGNAVKFTQRGAIRLVIGRPKPALQPERRDLQAGPVIAFSVTDTGVGISAENRERVFAPFEQVSDAQNHRYGGTGLGLAIAREVATLLGGELSMTSELGKGSTFTLFLPERVGAPAPLPAPDVPAQGAVEDDRARIAPGEPHLLAVEDDLVFAELIVELARAQGLKVVVASTGQEGLRLARHLRPRGILLDVGLPDLDGWTVMEHLRRDPETQRIPVHFVSGLDKPDRALALGAVGYVTKPVSAEELLDVIRRLSATVPSRPIRVLVVEDDAAGGMTLVELLRREELDARHVTSAGAALEALRHERFHCMILDLGLPDMDGLSVLEHLGSAQVEHAPAVVVYTGRALTREETGRLEAYAQAVIFKDGKSAERLMEEVRLFVRHLRDGVDPSKLASKPAPPTSTIRLDGKRILLADDDMRTVYALSALLRSKGLDVLIADTGKAALELLHKHPDVDAILMDVMMPEMDGYEAIRRIRREQRFKELPVIALTAKAMKGERERCIAEGASDYLAKPVDSERLLAMLSSWLGPQDAGVRN